MLDQPLLFLLTYLPVIIIPILFSFIDFVTVFLTRKKKFNPARDQKKFSLKEYSIMIPIFGDIKYLKNVSYLEKYGKRVILCTTTKESQEFNTALQNIAEKYEFRIFKSDVVLASSKHKPNPWKLFHLTLTKSEKTQILSDIARDEIILDSFQAVSSEYCIFLDGDTVSTEHLNHLTAEFIESGNDIASVRILASNRTTITEKLQQIEYELAMDARKVYPWLTSGASMIAKTSVIKHIMNNHSLFFSGGDIEIGKLAKLLGYKVGHIPFEFLTEVPSTFSAWTKQRIAWCGGGFRHAIINFNKFTWRHPLFFLYVSIVVYGLTPLRWYELIKNPHMLPIVIVIYWILLFITHKNSYRKELWLFPFFALFQVMVIVPLGMLKYFKMAWTTKNIGIIKIRRKISKDGSVKSKIYINNIVR